MKSLKDLIWSITSAFDGIIFFLVIPAIIVGLGFFAEIILNFFRGIF